MFETWPCSSSVGVSADAEPLLLGCSCLHLCLHVPHAVCMNCGVTRFVFWLDVVSGSWTTVGLDYYRLEEPTLHSLWGLVEGFFAYISPNLNGSGWNLEYKWGVRVQTHAKKFGGIAPGVHLRMQNHVFCHQYNADFRPLILHQFWTLLKHKTWFGVRMHTPVKCFRISARDFTGLKTAKNWYFWGVFVVRLQLKRHNFGRWESFRGLVDIPRMCHS